MNLNNSQALYDESILCPAVRWEDISFRGGQLQTMQTLKSPWHPALTRNYGLLMSIVFR
jgi:hypothetical protein